MSTPAPTSTSPAPTTDEHRDGGPRGEIYRRLLADLEAVLLGVDDPVTTMATAACLVHAALDDASWTGFYRVVAPGQLRVGPYQGPLGCIDIPFERGVCGAAARTRSTQLVADVHAFPGHIACDADARSEIVVPVLDRHGELAAVLDVDSHRPGAFDDEDRRGLEAVAALLSAHL